MPIRKRTGGILTTRQAVILAGGLGTRIASLSGGLPKTLLPVAGRPFLHHLLEYLAGQGITEVVLLLGVGADAVIAAVRDAETDEARTDRATGLTVVTSIEDRPLGTGGALRLALDHLDDRFFLVNGDTFLRVDLAGLEERHLAGLEAQHLPGLEAQHLPGPLPAATLALVRVADAGQKGSVELDDQGCIIRFLEKGKAGPGLINAGVYLIEKDAARDIPAGRPVSLEREILPAWIQRGGRPGLRGMLTDAYFVDIGLPEDYLGVINGFPSQA